MLQAAGGQGLVEKANIEKLKITDEQKTKIDAVLAEFTKQMDEMRSSGAFDFEKIGELNETHNKNALAVLTDEQKKTYAEMTGAPFDLTKLRQGFGGPGGKGGKGKGKGGKGKGKAAEKA